MLAQTVNPDIVSAGGSAGFSVQQNPVAALATGLPGVESAATSGASLTDIINTVVSAYSLTQTQKDFAETNRQLIAGGQAPISMAQYQGATPTGTATAGSFYLSPMMMLLIGLGLFVVMRKR